MTDELMTRQQWEQKVAGEACAMQGHDWEIVSTDSGEPLYIFCSNRCDAPKYQITRIEDEVTNKVFVRRTTFLGATVVQCFPIAESQTVLERWAQDAAENSPHYIYFFEETPE